MKLNTENGTYQPKYPVQTLGKALDILLYMKDSSSSEGVSIAELSEYLNMGKSTVHRLLDTLLAYNFVEKTYLGSAYKLGWGIFDIGNAVPKQHSLNSSTFYPLLEDLCNKFSETVNLGILNKNTVVILSKIEPNIRIRANVTVGGNEPLYCTSLGKIFLSSFTVQEVKDYFQSIEVHKLTNNTITLLDKMFEETRRVSEKGYAIDNEEFCVGLICVAMPVYDYHGNVVAAISLSGPSERMIQSKIALILPELKAACQQLSGYLGYR